MEHGGAADSTERLRGLGAIAHPVALLALVVLVVHDVLLRPMLPAVVAGKVSDVAGLVVFPLVIAALVAVVATDDDVPIRVGAWLTVVWFTAMKVVVVVADATVRLAEVVTPAAAITADPTDLLALPAVPVAVWVWRHRVPPRAWGAPILVFAVLWSAATSCSSPPSAYAVAVEPDGSFLVDLRGEAIRVSADGDVGEPGYLDADLADSTLQTSVCVDPTACFHADGHYVVVRDADGSTRTVLDIPENRFVYARRVGSCGQDDPFRTVQDMAANDHGVVVVAHGSHGVSVRTAAGEWVRPDIGATRFAGPLPPEHASLAVAIAVLGVLVATLPGGKLALVGALGLLAGQFAAVMSVVGGFALLLAWPALMVAMVAALVQIAAAVRRTSGSRAAAVAGGHVVAGTVAWLVVWAWAAAWIADLRVALVLMGLSVASATTISVVMGRRAGVWPVPPRESDGTGADGVLGGPIR